MSTSPTMKDLADWLREITAFPLAVRASDERRAELTALETYAVTLETEDGKLNVICDRELPPELQNAVDMSQIEQTVLGAARLAAMPTIAEARQTGGKQSVSFRVPLHLDGLTRNELAAAIWGVCKAHEFLALQLNAFKEIETMSAEMETLAAEEEAPPAEAAGPAPAAEAPPAEAAAPALEPTPAPPPPPAPAPAPPPPAPAAPAAPAGRFCPSCGKEARPEHRFCVGCGTPLEG